MSIGQRVKIAREDARMSQSELGEKIGVTKQTIHRHEKNGKGIPIESLIKISIETNTDTQWLIHGEAKEIKTEVKMAQLLRKIENEEQETINEIIQMAELILLKHHTMRIAS